MDYRVIKENDLFLLTDLAGNIDERNYGHGLYTKDTRFLSRFELKINGYPLNMLSSEADQNYVSTIVLTNPKTEDANGEMTLWPESIEIERTRFIYQDVLYETVKATNFNPQRESFELSLLFDADFRDMFIVRGFQNGEVGEKTGVAMIDGGFQIGYAGKDDVKRKLLVRWAEEPSGIKAGDAGVEATYRLELEAGASQIIEFAIVPVTGDEEPNLVPRETAIERLEASYAEWERDSTAVESDLPLFDKLYHRGLQDIRVLLTDLGYGRFPVAGLPWFAVPFGRDSLIAALQMLPIHPDIARGTILTMARFQGEKVDGWRDEQPGKIMHELRSGELANTNQIPFNPYYGSIDATPLFLVLIGEYVKWTGDSALLRDMLPHIRRALQWIDEYGDRDGSGFVAYFQESSKGIANQGWKDSGNSVVHRSGEYAKAPIALVEVQGYVYQAKRTLAELLGALRDASGADDWAAWAERLDAEAETLRERFEAKFWMEDDAFYAIALDEAGRQVESVTSNPGHALMSGMMKPERAAAVARKLVSPALFSGYGIRTMAEGETGYNPMSYHNGSIWPHDNSMCLLGLSAQGFRDEARTVMEGLLAASAFFENYRLPELFCGYSAERGKPVRYPVACSPQAWAAATPLTFVQAMLGLALDAARRRVTLAPTLPDGMTTLRVRRMRLGDGRLDVTVTRGADGAYAVKVDANTTGWVVEA
ncbi:amylo-alpha-1,6-glucosidase [Paenibacillus sp.]|uniref:amylo-alpha-1,6-glucosidase n=1 Tax=Paenibacillus sp. TaxID=58172 RepID=UPI002D4D5760|nr:amylo-alpha-1,6-glucosidase [Paenibacillus sp.]HZG84337.1 amylo-alpha-1,6-glucosidase [Paenibacillus sp.]